MEELMKRSATDFLKTLAPWVLGLAVAFPSLAFAQDEDEDDPFEEDEDEEEDEEPSEGDPNISREDDGEDVDDWSFEGEKKVEKKKVEEKAVGRELQAEPTRYGNSGNWYEVPVECGDCTSLMGQELGIEKPEVLRQFYDFLQIGSKRRDGKFVYPSIGENRPLGVKDGSKRVRIWMYVADSGTRLTDTYATIWDLKVKANGGLLYGRKYDLQAWTGEAYEETSKGYKAKSSFISSDKILKYLDLSAVKELDSGKANFQVGKEARMTFAGYSAFVRYDVDQSEIVKEQEALKAAAEAEAKRQRDQKAWFEKAEKYRDDKSWDDAITAYLKARDLGLANLDLNYGLGFSYQRIKEFGKATKEYRTVLDADPKDNDVRYNLAKIYEKQKDYDSAIREYETILKFDPDDDPVRDRVELLKAARDMAR
jgi:tetratricopeptide (TPR) repeat protein